MNSWEYSYNKVSKADWLRQMKKDLKEKPLESIQSEWWPGETLYPAIHAEDRAIESIFLPDYLFASAPRLIEWIDVADHEVKIVNQKILEALQYGAESLLLNCEETFEILLDEWLKDVVADIVEISIQIKDISSLHVLKTVPGHIQIRIPRAESDHSSLIAEFRKRTGLPEENLRFTYYLAGAGDWISSATLIFQKLLDDQKGLKNPDLNESSIINSQKILFEPDTDYLKQII